MTQKKGSGETEKRVFLIAADYVPNECDALQEAQQSGKASMTPSTDDGWKVCSSYWSNPSSVEYHCNDGHNKGLNSEKEQCSFPEVFMTTGQFCDSTHHYYCSDHVGTTGKEGDINSRCASSLQCTGNWRPFVEKSSKGGCANYAIGGPTLEMWVASWNQKHGTGVEKKGKNLYVNGKNGDSSNSGYYVGTTQEATLNNYYVSSTLGYKDTLYFPHKDISSLDLFDQAETAEEASEETTESSENASCWGYWLSSPSAGSTDDLMGVSCSGSVASRIYSNRGIRCSSRSFSEI